MALVATKAQRWAIYALYKRNPSGSPSYRHFRRRVFHAYGGYMGIAHYCGMFVGIEKDGYTHT